MRWCVQRWMYYPPILGGLFIWYWAGQTEATPALPLFGQTITALACAARNNGQMTAWVHTQQESTYEQQRINLAATRRTGSTGRATRRTPRRPRQCRWRSPTGIWPGFCSWLREAATAARRLAGRINQPLQRFGVWRTQTGYAFSFCDKGTVVRIQRGLLRT